MAGGAFVRYRDFPEAGGAGDDAEFAGGADCVGAGVEFDLVEAYCHCEGSISQGVELMDWEVGDQVAEAVCVENCAYVGAPGEAGWG